MSRSRAMRAAHYCPVFRTEGSSHIDFAWTERPWSFDVRQDFIEAIAELVVILKTTRLMDALYVPEGPDGKPCFMTTWLTPDGKSVQRRSQTRQGAPS